MTPAPQPTTGLDPFPPPPPAASACPKCAAPSTPAREAQQCGKCGATFLLRAGNLMDPSVKVPHPPPGAKDVTLKAPGLVVMSQGWLKEDRLVFGALDPIVGKFPLDIEEKAVHYRFLYSVAVWRALNVAAAVGFFFISVPVGLGGIALVATLNPAGIVFGLLLLALAAFHGYVVFGRRAMRLRVVGTQNRVLDMTFVGRIAKRQRFVDELFRRCGLPPGDAP